MGLNEPLWKQYLTFPRRPGRGDLGNSLIPEPVSEQISSSALHAGADGRRDPDRSVLGIPIGVITAVRRNSAGLYRPVSR